MKQRSTCTALALAGLLAASVSGAELSQSVLRQSVFRVYVTAQGFDYSAPWQKGSIESYTGSAFLIGRRRILTNAHNVSNAIRIQLQKDGDARKYAARVSFAAHDCDLALLEVEDDRFFRGTHELPLGADLPDLNDEVLVAGFPLGGQRISVTRGVVSRIDYAGYVHSAVDQHLVMQVDAAINPGNSGGPAFFDNRVVGVAFQGIQWAENIGYVIPLPVIHRMLKDVEDGRYDGYPELGAGFIPGINPALRALHGLPDDRDGILVATVDPFGAANGELRPGDFLTAIDGIPISDEGFITLGNHPVLFAELFEQMQRGDAVTFDVWRDRALQSVRVPLSHPDDPFVFRKSYDAPPRYLVHAGLLFVPLSWEYIAELLGGDAPDANTTATLHLANYIKREGGHTERSEIVVFMRRLPHPVNDHAGPFLHGAVRRANAHPIATLTDLARALQAPTNGFHVIEFDDLPVPLVLDAAATESAARTLLEQYGIPGASRL